MEGDGTAVFLKFEMEKEQIMTTPLFLLIMGTSKALVPHLPLYVFDFPNL